MRMVSWIVVVGAVAWLLYAQLKIHFPEEALADISDETVSGTVDGARMASGADAPDDATLAALAYGDVFPMIEAIDTVAFLDRIDATTIIRSRDPSVAPSDILLTLDDGERVHQFPVGQYGELSLPARPEWRDSGFVVRSNQPAGSLDLQVTFIMRALPGAEVEYAWLWESVEQMDTAMTAMQAAGVVPPGEVAGVIFEFKPGQRGTMRAGSGPGSAVVTADENGYLRFEMSPALLTDNPTLVFSPLPQRMVPLLVPPGAAGDGSNGGQ